MSGSNKPQDVMGTVRKWTLQYHGEEHSGRIGVTDHNDTAIPYPRGVTNVHVLEATPTLQLLDKLEYSLKRIAENEIGPPYEFSCEEMQTEALDALTELRKWKDGLK